VQLRGLEVANIRSFERASLDLGPGTTLLVGDVGAGKSSLLYAVEMALFGVAEIDAAFLVRHGTQHAEVAVTLEEDDHRYVVRRRFRKVRRRGREAFEPEKLTFAEDGRLTSYSATEIRQRVIDLLGFPDNPNPHAHSDLWRWAIYVPQERMREILATGPEQRLETVRKALGVERYRTAAENAQLLAADLRVGARQRREESARLAHWDVEFAESSQEADRLRVDRLALSDEVTRGLERLEAARARLRAAEEGLARLETDRAERERLVREAADDTDALANLDRRRETLRAETATAVREAEPLRRLAGDRSRWASARSAAEEAVRAQRAEVDRRAEGLRELARVAAALEASERRAGELEAAVQRVREARAEGARAAEELLGQAPLKEPPCPTPRPLSEIESELARTVAAEHDAVERLARARARLDQIADLLRRGVCPTCEQPVEPAGFEAHRTEAAQGVERAEALRASCADDRLRLDSELKARERYERALERWTELERRRAQARTTLTRHDAELAAATEASAAAGGEVGEARQRLQRLSPIEAEVARLRVGLEAAERALAEVSAQERGAGQAEERIRLLEAVTERARGETSRLEVDAAAIRRRRDERGQRIASLENRLKSTEPASRELETARAEALTGERHLAEARAALVRADTRLDALVERVAMAERRRTERATLVAEAADLEAKAAWVGEPFRLAVLRMEKEILAHAQAAFDRAFGRFFASLIDDPTLVARTDVSFTPEVTIAGQATPAEALSGGERTSLALAFRLALASVVRQLGSVRLRTLLLDEPTDGFSSEQVVRMGELLEELALPQVILVSHESELTGIADRTVRVVKVGGRSSLERDTGETDGEPKHGAARGRGPLTPAPATPARSRPP
jgi:DNA repair protein SbcC/Rad50